MRTDLKHSGDDTAGAVYRFQAFSFNNQTASPSNLPETVMQASSNSPSTHTSNTDTKSSNAKRTERAQELSSTDRVVHVVEQLAETMNIAINEIREINENAKLLSLNARIEAARAGSSGAAFGVVAQEMQSLSNNTAVVADDMANKTRNSINELVEIIGGNVRGERLADIALNSIDLIDRNLYERTCDVRWWATDSSVVEALQNPSKEASDYASKRLGVILNAYTVYHDLVLCDAKGKVIANGRPMQFNSVGRDESKSPWFAKAIATRSGDEFAFQSAHCSSLAKDQSVLIYSSSVRRNGGASEPILGALGVVFNWEALSNAVLTNASIDAAEAKRTLRFITDRDFQVLASSKPLPRDFRLPVEHLGGILSLGKGHCVLKVDGKDACVAHALSPGFESYATGWRSFLIQELS